MLLGVLAGACGSTEDPGPVCLGTTSDATHVADLGCATDFEALASRPLDATIPGARSVKTVMDRVDGDALYFQNSVTYQTHYQFVSEHLSGNGLPVASSAFHRVRASAMGFKNVIRPTSSVAMTASPMLFNVVK